MACVRGVMVEVRMADQLRDLKELLTSSGDVSIAVAYMDSYGLKIIKNHLEVNPDSGQKFRILVNLKDDAVSPQVVDKLVKLVETYGARFQCREYFIRGQGILHTKLFISHSSGRVKTFVTGSHNLTENALKWNSEHSLRVDCENDLALSQRILAFFDSLWNNDHCANVLGHGRAQEYRRNYRRNRRNRNGLAELSAPIRQAGEIRHWLLKFNITEPYICNAEENYYNFGILRENGEDEWGEQITLAEPRDYLENSMREGDRCLFYHADTTDSRKSEIVGTVSLTREAHEAASGSGIMVITIAIDTEFEHPIRRPTLRRDAMLENMSLFQPPYQHSLLPVTQMEYAQILCMGLGGNQP